VLDAVMAQPQQPPGTEPAEAAGAPTSEPPSDLDQVRRTSMAAERTWLAWWRTALGASAGALAVGIPLYNASRDTDGVLRTLCV